jgi:hypothetical protein
LTATALIGESFPRGTGKTRPKSLGQAFLSLMVLKRPLKRIVIINKKTKASEALGIPIWGARLSRLVLSSHFQEHNYKYSSIIDTVPTTSMGVRSEQIKLFRR